MSQRNDAILERSDIREDMPLEEQYIALSVLNCERLPMMEILLERFALSLSSVMRGLSTTPLSVELEAVRYVPYSAAIDTRGDGPLISIAMADKWNGRLAVVLERSMLFPALEVMFGGGKTDKAFNATRPGYTRIERTFAEQLSRIILDELAASFDQIDTVSFDIERMEMNTQLASLAQAISPTVLATLKIEIGATVGRFHLIVPHATLDPVRKNLLQVFFGEHFGADETWRDHLRNRVQATQVTLRAVYKELTVSMRDVLGWSEGDTLEFYVAPDHEASLVCDGMELFRGDVGHLDDMRMAVQITHDSAERIAALGADGQGASGAARTQDKTGTDTK